jgi:TRAP-type transport system periplasmic protein
MNQQIGEDPFFGIESLPFLATGYEDLERLQKLTRPHFEEISERFNQKLLYVTPWPPQSVFANRAIEDAGDFAGLTIRTIDKNATDFFQALGAQPVQMPWGEVVPALASGVLNAVSTSSTSGVDGRFWEFLSHHNRLQWQMNSQMVTVNLDAWNALSPEHQQAIEELANRMEKEFWQVSIAEDEKNIAELEANEMATVSPSEELRAKLREVGEGFWASYVEEVGPRAEQVIADYTAAQWPGIPGDARVLAFRQD